MSISIIENEALRPFWPEHLGGRLYNNSLAVGATATVAHTADTLFATPVYVPATATYTVLGMEITTGASGSMRLGIYTDVGGTPSALVVDAGVVFTSTPAQFRSVTISQTLTPGWYWLASVSTAGPTVRATTATAALQLLGFSSGTDTTVHAGWSASLVYTTLPSTFTGGGSLMTTNPPRHMIGI